MCQPGYFIEIPLFHRFGQFEFKLLGRLKKKCRIVFDTIQSEATDIIFNY